MSSAIDTLQSEPPQTMPPTREEREHSTALTVADAPMFIDITEETDDDTEEATSLYPRKTPIGFRLWENALKNPSLLLDIHREESRLRNHPFLTRRLKETRGDLDQALLAERLPQLTPADRTRLIQTRIYQEKIRPLLFVFERLIGVTPGIIERLERASRNLEEKPFVGVEEIENVEIMVLDVRGFSTTTAEKGEKLTAEVMGRDFFTPVFKRLGEKGHGWRAIEIEGDAMILIKKPGTQGLSAEKMAQKIATDVPLSLRIILATGKAQIIMTEDGQLLIEGETMDAIKKTERTVKKEEAKAKSPTPTTIHRVENGNVISVQVSGEHPPPPLPMESDIHFFQGLLLEQIPGITNFTEESLKAFYDALSDQTALVASQHDLSILQAEQPVERNTLCAFIKAQRRINPENYFQELTKMGRLLRKINIFGGSVLKYRIRDGYLEAVVPFTSGFYKENRAFYWLQTLKENLADYVVSFDKGDIITSCMGDNTQGVQTAVSGPINLAHRGANVPLPDNCPDSLKGTIRLTQTALDAFKEAGIIPDGISLTWSPDLRSFGPTSLIICNALTKKQGAEYVRTAVADKICKKIQTQRQGGCFNLQGPEGTCKEATLTAIAEKIEQNFGFQITRLSGYYQPVSFAGIREIFEHTFKMEKNFQEWLDRAPATPEQKNAWLKLYQALTGETIAVLGTLEYTHRECVNLIKEVPQNDETIVLQKCKFKPDGQVELA